MSWSKEPPSEPGVYWIRHAGASIEADVGLVDGRLMATTDRGVVVAVADVCHWEWWPTALSEEDMSPEAKQRRR
jgi:hypothetical protein